MQLQKVQKLCRMVDSAATYSTKPFALGCPRPAPLPQCHLPDVLPLLCLLLSSSPVLFGRDEAPMVMAMSKSTLCTQPLQQDPFNPLARAEKALTEQDSPQNKVLYAEVTAARQIRAPTTLRLWLLQINWLGFGSTSGISEPIG